MFQDEEDSAGPARPARTNRLGGSPSGSPDVAGGRQSHCQAAEPSPFGSRDWLAREADIVRAAKRAADAATAAEHAIIACQLTANGRAPAAPSAAAAPFAALADAAQLACEAYVWEFRRAPIASLGDGPSAVGSACRGRRALEARLDRLEKIMFERLRALESPAVSPAESPADPPAESPADPPAEPKKSRRYGRTGGLRPGPRWRILGAAGPAQPKKSRRYGRTGSLQLGPRWRVLAAPGPARPEKARA